MTIFYTRTVPEAPKVSPTPDEYDTTDFSVGRYPVTEPENPGTPYLPTTEDAQWWEKYPSSGPGGKNQTFPKDAHLWMANDKDGDGVVTYAEMGQRMLEVSKFWDSLNLGKQIKLSKHKAGKDATFNGVDMKPVMLLPGRDPFEFGDIQTLSISTHAESFPVRILGRRNAIGFTKGTRTIAGSMVFTTLDMYPWYKAMGAQELPLWENSTDFPLADSLPPFDIVVTMHNETDPWGARMMLYGVRIIDDGLVMSIDDLVTENTYSFVAQGIAPIHKSKNWFVEIDERYTKAKNERYGG